VYYSNRGPSPDRGCRNDAIVGNTGTVAGDVAAANGDGATAAPGVAVDVVVAGV
jgi:hypothetical protein